MKSGQFVIGMVNGTIETYESPDLALLLPPDKLNILWELGKNRPLGNYRFVDYDNRVVAKSTIMQSEPDDLGRKFTINHTVLVKYDASIIHDGLKYLFDPENFYVAYQSGQLDFDMPPTPPLQNPLPLPFEETLNE